MTRPLKYVENAKWLPIRFDKDSEQYILEFPIDEKSNGVLFCIVFTVIFSAMLIKHPLVKLWELIIAPIFYSFLMLGSFIMILDFYYKKVYLDSIQIKKTYILKRIKTIKYENIISISYSKFKSAVILLDNMGNKIAVERSMVGFVDFIEILKKKKLFCLFDAKIKNYITKMYDEPESKIRLKMYK